MTDSRPPRVEQTGLRARALLMALVCMAGVALPRAPALGQDSASEAAAVRESALAQEQALQRLLERQTNQREQGKLGRHEARALLEPEAEAVLSSEIGGRIDELPYDEGEHFSRGDVLVGFDCSFHRAELRAAQAELTKAERSLENKRQLAELNSIGELEVALAEAEVSKTRARLETRTLFVQRCELKAPYDGRVVARPVNAHETVGEGEELMSVIATQGLRIRLIVPSGWLAWMEPGQAFRLTVDETQQSYDAQVSTIGARINPVSQTVPLLGRLVDEPAGKALLPGMSGTARFERPQD